MYVCGLAWYRHTPGKGTTSARLIMLIVFIHVKVSVANVRDYSLFIEFEIDVT